MAEKLTDTQYDEKSCGVVLFRYSGAACLSGRQGRASQQEVRPKDGHLEKDGVVLYLLLHYPSGHWDLPKGHVEIGEEEHETAARELLEETGVSDIQFIEGFREEISYQYKKEKHPSKKQVVFFLAKTNLEKIKVSFEHRGFKWLPYTAALDRLTFENAKNLIKKAKKILEGG